MKRWIKALLYPLYEQRLIRSLDLTKTPQHIGVILDGNRRWAKANPTADGDVSTSRGHRAGANKIVALLDWCEEVNVKVVTLWLLSNDNLKREAAELNPLLAIIGETVAELGKLGRWEVRPMGSLELLPEELRTKLNSVAAKSKGIEGVIVNVAIGYGGRKEIVDAVKNVISESARSGKSAQEIADALSVEDINKNLYTAGQPDPELVIRTSGEQRLGGFLL